MILRETTRFNLTKINPFIALFRQGYLATVVILMRAGADPTLKDNEGFSCIHLAAQFGHTAIVAYLVAKGVSPNTPDKNSMTPLMWSAYKVNRYIKYQVIIARATRFARMQRHYVGYF